MTKLSSKRILEEAKDDDPSSIKTLTLTHRALADVSCLVEFKNLERLDLGSNKLTSLEGLKPCVNLKWLSVVQNLLHSLSGIEGLTNLNVLNAGKNKLKSMDEITSLVSLRAIILNDNEISSICKLEQLKELNTLVLSRNPIRKFGASLAKNNLVTKLSLSNCQIEVIGSSLTSCTDLKELRLAHNNIETLPVELGHNSRLRSLDLGNNSITNWSDVKVLSSLVNLKNLNLQGNPISDLQSTAKKIKKLLPKLQIYNGKPVDKTATQEGDKVTASVVDDVKDEENNLIEVPSKKKKLKKHHGSDDDTVNVWDQHMELKREERLNDQTSNHMEKDSREKKAKRKSRLEQTEEEENISEQSGIPSVHVKGEKKQERRKKELVTKVHEDDVGIGKSAKKSKNSTKASDGMFIDDTVNSDMVKKHKRRDKASMTPDNGEDKRVMGKSERKSRKKSKPSNDTSVIDNGEAPFMELVANEEAGNDMNNDLNVHMKTGSTYGIVTIPTNVKQNKKQSLSASAILELSSTVEIGLGGPSAWD